jgi:hypothetical protein
MCKFNILGQCNRGKGCVFAHSPAELQPMPDLSKTKLCKTLLSTGKCQDPHCTYAHNKEELRSDQAVDRSLHSKAQQKTPLHAMSTAKHNSPESFVPTPAIWGEEFTPSLFGMPWNFGWHVPLETDMTCIGAEDDKPRASLVDNLDDGETHSGSSETPFAGALSEDVNVVDSEDGPIYINASMQMSAPPISAPLKLVRSADGELCALGDV